MNARQASSGRPFRVLGLQQVAVGGLDAAVLAHLWLDLLGLTRVGVYRSERENVDEVIARCGQGANAVEVDLMTPLNPEKKPRVHEPA
ncbi:MAG: VOC family protein, partial [Myxococcota bacterium]